MKAIVKTDFNLPGQAGKYVGKVRDVYDIAGKYLVMVVTDRISAFDVVLPEGIPYKGQILNRIAAKFLDATRDILPNWKLAVPDPCVTVGYKCEPFQVEMVIRGYLAGHAWREYKAGKRSISDARCRTEWWRIRNSRSPWSLRPRRRLKATTKTSPRRRSSPADWSDGRTTKTRGLYPRDFQRGAEIAAKEGLILVDTKYEFGKRDGVIYLMDEVHTPDSSRYFYADGYAERLDAGERQRQLQGVRPGMADGERIPGT